MIPQEYILNGTDFIVLVGLSFVTIALFVVITGKKK